MKLFLECCKSKDKDTTYTVLKVDFGYRVASLFELPKDVISEFADIKISDFYRLKEGDKIEIGEVVRKLK